jgi:hypothetical protein
VVLTAAPASCGAARAAQKRKQPRQRDAEAHPACKQQDNIDIAKARESGALRKLKQSDRTNKDRDKERRSEGSGLSHGDLSINGSKIQVEES